MGYHALPLWVHTHLICSLVTECMFFIHKDDLYTASHFHSQAENKACPWLLFVFAKKIILKDKAWLKPSLQRWNILRWEPIVYPSHVCALTHAFETVDLNQGFYLQDVLITTFRWLKEKMKTSFNIWARLSQAWFGKFRKCFFETWDCPNSVVPSNLHLHLVKRIL